MLLSGGARPLLITQSTYDAAFWMLQIKIKYIQNNLGQLCHVPQPSAFTFTCAAVRSARLELMRSLVSAGTFGDSRGKGASSSPASKCPCGSLGFSAGLPPLQAAGPTLPNPSRKWHLRFCPAADSQDFSHPHLAVVSPLCSLCEEAASSGSSEILPTTSTKGFAAKGRNILSRGPPTFRTLLYTKR